MANGISVSQRPAPAERLHTLDGLRGIAALIVVGGHLIGWIGRLPMPRNYLAVDLFFLISGFVLGRVYEPRFADGWTTGRFLLNRYVRLYPLYLLGTLLGVVAGVAALLLGQSHMGAGGLTVATVAGLLLLPSPTWGRSGAVMPLNNPGWSLHFELIANLLFALARRWLSDAVLAGASLACGAALLWGFATHQAFGGSNWDGFGWGYPQVGYSFALGVLMHRVHPGARWRSDAAWLPLLAAAFVMLSPRPGGWFFEGAAVLVLFPAILWLAVLVEPRRPAPFAWLGLLSYPLYVTHSPLQHMAERAVAISTSTRRSTRRPRASRSWVLRPLPRC